MGLDCSIKLDEGLTTGRTISIRSIAESSNRNHYSRFVIDHIQDCKDCSPQAYLELVLDVSLRGARSDVPQGTKNRSAMDSLVSLGVEFGKFFRKKIDNRIVNEFIWRSGVITAIVCYSDRLSEDEFHNGLREFITNLKSGLYPDHFVEALPSLFDQQRRHRRASVVDSVESKVMGVIQFCNYNERFPTKEELKKIISINKIMNS